MKRQTTVVGRTVDKVRTFNTHQGSPGAAVTIATDRTSPVVRYNLNPLEEPQGLEPERTSSYTTLFAFGDKVPLLLGLGKERKVRATGSIRYLSRTVRGRQIREGQLTVATLTRMGLDQAEG